MDDEPALGQETTRQERRDAVLNRERVLAAARQLFVEQGVDATSMNQIAQAAGVGPGTLYRNFAHKGELCLALLEDDIEVFQRQVGAILGGPTAPKSALARLERLLDELLRVTESHVPLLAGAREAFAGRRRFDHYQTPFYSWLHAEMTGLLREAVEAREIAPLDADFTADAIAAAIAPPLVSFLREHRGFDRARIAAGVRRLFVDGLRAGQPSD